MADNSGSGGAGARNGGNKLRGVALAIVLLSVALCAYTVWLVGRPLFWRMYADWTEKGTKSTASGEPARRARAGWMLARDAAAAAPGSAPGSARGNAAPATKRCVAAVSSLCVPLVRTPAAAAAADLIPGLAHTANHASGAHGRGARRRAPQVV